MKIVKKEDARETVKLKNIVPGDLFLCRLTGRYYMRLADGGLNNAVSLSDGRLYGFAPESVALPADGVLVLE